MDHKFGDYRTLMTEAPHLYTTGQTLVVSAVMIFFGFV
jgi:hypothetical protein